MAGGSLRRVSSLMGSCPFAIDVAEELKIPIITFRTQSACSTWTYFHLTKLIEEGEVPFQ
ncbi:hypothetical protein OIU78_019469, partial [Salix suchowensis]